MLRSNLWDYADAYKLVKGTITITDAYKLVKGTIRITGNAGPDPDRNAPRTAAQLLVARQADERNKDVIFKNCAPFTKCISRINNIDIDNAQDIGIVMPMYNFIEYSYNYSKTSGSLWKYYKDDPKDNIADSESFKPKIKITEDTPADGNTKDVEVIVPLKYLSNFWRALEMLLINCEVNLILT